MSDSIKTRALTESLEETQRLWRQEQGRTRRLEAEVRRLRRIKEAAREVVSEYYERTDARDTTPGTAFVSGEPITKLRDLLAWSYKSDPVSSEEAQR